MREAVRLDWRLLWRSLQQSSGELWLAVGAAGLAFSTIGESSARFGAAIATGQLARGESAAIVGMHVWATFGAAFIFALAAGELPFTRRLLADLDARPVTRGHAFLALQASSLVGRHALAPFTVGLPLLVLFASWLDGPAFVAAIASSIVMMRLAVPLLTIGTRVASASPGVAGVVVAAAVISAAVVWWILPTDVARWLPPAMVMRIAFDGPASVSAWAGLLAWTLALAAFEYWSMRLEKTTPSTTAARRPVTTVPRLARVMARLSATPPVLLHAELLRFTRWRRFQLAWVMGAVLMALVGGRLRDDAAVLPLVLFSLVPAFIAASTMANMFATDRSGFQAFLLLPVRIDQVLRAKIVVVAAFVLVAELTGWSLLAARGTIVLSPAVLGCWLLAAGYFLWLAGLGALTSVMFPAPSDAQSVGGALVPAPTGAIVTLGGSLYAGAALGLSYLVDSGRSSPAVFVAAAAALLVVGGGAAAAISRLSTRLISVRREEMVFTLNAGRGART